MVTTKIYANVEVRADYDKSPRLWRATVHTHPVGDQIGLAEYAGTREQAIVNAVASYFEARAAAAMLEAR